MGKEELLIAIDEPNYSIFLDLLNQHANKRNPLDLHDILIELTLPQLEHIWNVLHSWADEQIIKSQGIGSTSEPNLANQQDGPLDPQDAEPGGQVTQNRLQDAAEMAVGCSRENGDERAQTTEDVAVPAEPYKEDLLLGILDFALIYVGSVKGFDAIIPDKLLELVGYLHGMVDVLEGKVQEKVITLCELWWNQDLVERDQLVANILPIFIQSSLSKNGRKKDVQSVYNLRRALQVLEFSAALEDLLVASAACSLYLKCDEGVKWLSELFSWGSLVCRLHRSVKSVLPDCTREQSAKYAEVYFRAWKKSEGDVKKLIEESCFQDLMYAAVHVDPLTGRLSANLHHLLHHIHRHKLHHVVEKTLFNLYDPFLWRSLKAANGYVRMNATGILCDVFPLSDHTLTHQERDDLFEKQCHTIITLLTDPCHLVRITAIKGTCRILNNYWLVIPSQIIQTIFQKLLSELLCDASSAEVRTQVIKGLTSLLDNNNAVPFLREILPRISDSFDDISANVRIAFVHLLLKIKALKILRYWNIVPVNHLLHRLEDDTPAVCKLLTQLLLSSFHPTQREDKELLERCLALLEENRGAARRFYQYASRTLDLPSTVHFILLIWRCLRNYIAARQAVDSTSDEDCSDVSSESQPASSGGGTPKSSTSKRDSIQSLRGLALSSDDKENRAVPRQRTKLTASRMDKKRRQDSGNKGEAEEEAEDLEGSPLDNPMVIGGLLDTIVILWSSNAARFSQPHNQKYLEVLRTRISKSMPLFFKVFKDSKDVSQTLLYLSSFLPKTLVPTLLGHCLSRLRSLQQDELQDDEDSYVIYINALCNWNRVDDILELATDWLVEGFNTVTASNTKERRLSGRGVRFHETHTAQPNLALRLIRHLLQHPMNKLAALSKNRPLVLELTETIKAVKDLITERLTQGEELSNLCSDSFLCECWTQYLSLISVLHEPPKEAPGNRQGEEEEDEEEIDVSFDSCQHIEECMEWANNVLLPVLNEESGGKRKSRGGEDAVKMAVVMLNQLVTTANNLIIIGVADPTFVMRLCVFTRALLKTGVCMSFWEISCLIAMEGYQHLQVYGDPQVATEEAVTPVDLFNSCVTSISETLRGDRPLPKEVDTFEKTLALALTTFAQGKKDVQIEVLQHLALTIVDHLCYDIDKMKGVDRDLKSISELGGCVSLLIGVCRSRVKLSMGLMESLTSVTDSVLDTTALLALTHLLRVLSLDPGKISRYNLKQAVSAVDNIVPQIIFPIGLEESRDADDTSNIYGDYAKATKEILDALKNSLGIV